jgi:hypothetical protein
MNKMKLGRRNYGEMKLPRRPVASRKSHSKVAAALGGVRVYPGFRK